MMNTIYRYFLGIHCITYVVITLTFIAHVGSDEILATSEEDPSTLKSPNIAQDPSEDSDLIPESANDDQDLKLKICIFLI